MHRRIVRVNAGGRCFDTLWETLCKYPASPLGKLVSEGATPLRSRRGSKWVRPSNAPTHECFLDCDPAVFGNVLGFLRTGNIALPTDDEGLRRATVAQLESWGLLGVAFPPQPAGSAPDDNSGASGVATAYEREVDLPDMLVVQLCDHMQLEQGVKRHAMTITYGADGFRLRRLCTKVRKDLNTQVSNTYWQMYQTNERAAFFVSAKMSNGSADLLLTSVSQNIIAHTEKMGYSLVNSYVTLSPDLNKTSIRVFLHWLIFRRIRAPSLEEQDEAGYLALTDKGNSQQQEQSDESGAPSNDAAEAMFRHYEPPPVGPQKPPFSVPVVPAGQRVAKIWND